MYLRLGRVVESDQGSTGDRQTRIRPRFVVPKTTTSGQYGMGTASFTVLVVSGRSVSRRPSTAGVFTATTAPCRRRAGAGREARRRRRQEKRILVSSYTRPPSHTAGGLCRPDYVLLCKKVLRFSQDPGSLRPVSDGTDPDIRGRCSVPHLFFPLAPSTHFWEGGVEVCRRQGT